MVDYLRVGVITSPHGLRGDVKVFPTTDDVNRFKKLKKAYIDTGKEKMPVTVEQARFFKNMVILKFKEMNRIEDCEPFRNKDILITRDQAVKLNPDENFIADLIGMTAVSDDETLKGTLTDVIETGANDVYVIALEDGRELLLPAIKECILKVDVEGEQLTFHLMEGLL